MIKRVISKAYFLEYIIRSIILIIQNADIRNAKFKFDIMIHLDEYLKEYYILFNAYDGIPHHDS